MRHSAWTSLFLCLALAACQPSGGMPAERVEAARDASPPDEQAGSRLAPVDSLAGDWRVAGIDGVALDEPMGLSLTGDETQLWWHPRCAGVARTYRIEGQGIAFAQVEPLRPAGSPPPVVCSIGLPPRLADVVRAMDDAVDVARTPSNGVQISGPNHSVTLYAQ